MKKAICNYILFISGSLLLLSGCAGSQSWNADSYGSSDDDSDYEVADYDFGRWTGDGSYLNADLAHCNSFNLVVNGKKILSGLVQHPTDTYGDLYDDKLIMKVTSIDPAWWANGNSWIQFNAVQESRTLGEEKSPPLLFHVVSSKPNNYYSISPGDLRAQGISAAPFYLIIEGTTRDWNRVDVASSSTGTSFNWTSFLIPSFEANPSVYKKESEVTENLWRLHPFYSLTGQSLDFGKKASAYCFYYPK